MLELCICQLIICLTTGENGPPDDRVAITNDASRGYYAHEQLSATSEGHELITELKKCWAFAPQESKEVILRLQVTNDAYNLNEYNEPWYSKKKLTHHEP